MRISLMIRKIYLSLFIAAAILAVIVYPNSAAAVSLKTTSVIGDSSIMLSDVFSGLPEGKDKVLGPAPRPGQDMTLNARTLMRIAIALDLPWRPAHSGEYIVLSRAATVIGSAMIEDALQAEIAESGMNGSYKLAFAGSLTEMILPLDSPANVEVQHLNLRQDQNRFEATLVAPSKEAPIQTIRVSGAIHRMIDVPVLLNTLRKGQVIGVRDIDFVPFREDQIRNDMALNSEDLIGMTPRRVVLPGKSVRMNEIEQPVIVERGDYVTMIFDDGGMRLTSKGKALENGAKGDVVRVSNATSSRTVEATVTAQREVIVTQF